MKQRTERKYLQEFVFGGIDGSVTTFAVVAGVMGASLNSTIVLILGFANLLGDGFSMAVSNYLATKSGIELTRYSKFKLRKNPVKTGFATFFSFFIIGMIPLISFIFANFFPFIEKNQFLLSIIFTGVALLIVGAIKGRVVKKHPFRAALETLMIGGIAALLAFSVGYLLRMIIG